MRMSRTGWVLTLVAAGTVALLAPDADALARDVGGSSFPTALLAVASLLGLGLAAWSLLAATAILAGGSSRLVAAIAPVAMRRALLAGAAGVLVVGPAHAETLAAPDAGHHLVDGLPLPDRPDVAERAVRGVLPAAAGPRVVEVRRGDTLWAIAARSLPAGSTATEIAEATTRWHRVNRDVIGDDPDLIVPAQQLVPPTGKDLP